MIGLPLALLFLLIDKPRIQVEHKPYRTVLVQLVPILTVVAPRPDSHRPHPEPCLVSTSISNG
jgi:hypothetical protein